VKIQSGLDNAEVLRLPGRPAPIKEQKAFVALNLATRSYVLENGRVVAAGESQTLAADPRVKRAYLR